MKRQIRDNSDVSVYALRVNGTYAAPGSIIAPRAALRTAALMAFWIFGVDLAPAEGVPSNVNASAVERHATDITSEGFAKHPANSELLSGDCCALKSVTGSHLASSGVATIFDTSDFPPRWHCGTWTATHGWVHIIADLAIWGAYLSIPIVLVYYVRRRNDVPFQKIFILFALFILSCGTGHLMEAVIFWWPAYRLAALLKILTAVVSWATVLAMLPVLPKALALPGLRKANADLESELKRRLAAELALKEQKLRLNAIIDSSLDGLITINERGIIESFNPVAEKMFMMREAEVVGKEMAELIIPPRLREEHRAGLARFLTTGESHIVGERVEIVALRANGSEFPVELTIGAVRRARGYLFVGQIRDISDRKKAEQRFQLAVEAAPNAMIMVNAEGRIVMVNGRAEQMFGYAREEMVGQTVELLLPEQFQQSHVAQRTAYLNCPEPRAMGAGRDLFARHKNGKLIPVEIGLNPIETEEGIFVLSAIVDITERNRIEQRFHRAVEAAPNAMVMTNSTGQIVMVNTSAENMFGYLRGEMIGQLVEMLLPEEYRGSHVAQRANYFSNPEPRAMGAGRDLFARHKDGRLIPVEIGLNPIETEEGVFVLSAILDITERKRAEKELERQSEQLRDQNKELVAANAELDDFSFVASHDLQEPLRKLISFSTLLRSDLGGDLPEQASRDLDFITEAANRMQNLVRDLLRLSRAGRGAVKIEALPLNDCVERALSALSARIEETKAVITKPSLPAAMGDATLVTQLFQNLIGNGLKFQAAGVRPHVTITVEREGDQWILGVKDNGIGLKMEFADQIFLPFKRLHGRQEYEGTGIGLAICRKAVERMGGRIWVESAPGEGAHFKFTLREEVEVPELETASV